MKYSKRTLFAPRMCWRAFAVIASFLMLMASVSANQVGSIVRFSSNMGEFDLGLFDSKTPKSVKNFIGYIQRGDYQNSIFHRSVPRFVVQCGGFRLKGTSLDVVPSAGPVVNEPGISNLRGTVAMAKLGGDPNSATNQWFINLGNNAANLDNQNGGFTVFGKVLGNGMAVADAIAGLEVFDASGYLKNGAFGELPLRAPELSVPNLVTINATRALATGSMAFEFDFASGQQGFVAGFADLPANYKPADYALDSGLRARPNPPGGGSSLYIAGTNRSADLWMFWKKKLTGLQANTVYDVVMDVEFLSDVEKGSVGVGGSPGESVFVKLGASAIEPVAASDKNGWLRLNADKGNQSNAGKNALVVGNVAKPAGSPKGLLALQRTTRGARLRINTDASGSMWIFFGTDSGFEGRSSLYYTRCAAVLEPVGKLQQISFSLPETLPFGAAPLTLNATTTSLLGVTFFSSNTTVARIENGRLQLAGVGETKITASQSGNAQWTAAEPVVRTLKVTKGDQQIVFANPGNSSFTAGKSITLNGTATSKLDVAFASSNSTTLEIKGQTATVRARGQVTITATQPGNANWNAAPAVKQTITIK